MAKVMIFGTFDTLHPGHRYLINEARKYGEVHAVVALDETVRKVKGRLPVHPIAERIRQLAELGVTAHQGDDADRLKVFRELQPDAVLLGYDQKVFVDTLHDFIGQEKLATKVITLTPFQSDLFKSSKIRTVAEDPQAGFLLIDKPPGEPSMRTVTQLRNITGIQQIGFAGTLDPLASGLLILGVSKATTILDWFHLFPKTYVATAELGVISDTYDSEGTITKKQHSEPSREDMEDTLRAFVGDLLQEPPMFSAKKIEGQRLYEIARKGETVERKKQAIRIHSLELILYQYPEVQFRVTCSSGTYVRSLVHDIGVALETGAIVTKLRRTAIGPYSVDAAIMVQDLNKDSWYRKVLKHTDVLKAVQLHLDEHTSRKVYG